MACRSVDAHHPVLSPADHRLLVPPPLEELYETYRQELAGDPGDTVTLKVGQGARAPPTPQAGHSPPLPAQGTSLPKVPQGTGTESLRDAERDSVRGQSCEHPTPLQHGALPPLRPTGDRYRVGITTPHVHGAAAVAEGEGRPLSSSTPTPLFKKTPWAQQPGSTAVPTPPPSRGTVAQEVSTAVPAAPKPRGGDAYGYRVSQQRTPRASLSTRHDSSPGSGTSSEAAVAAGRGELSGRRGWVGGCALLMVPPCRRAPGDSKNHQEHHGYGHPARVPHPREHPPAPTGAHGGAGWPRAVARRQRGQPGGDGHPLPGDMAAGAQEGRQGAGEEGGIAGWQKEIEAATFLRGLWPRGRCRHGGAMPGEEGRVGRPPPAPLGIPLPTIGSTPMSPHTRRGSSPKHRARRPSLWQSAVPRAPPPPSNALQSRSEHAVPVGVQAASTPGPPKVLPGVKPPRWQPPGEPPAGDGVQGPSPPPRAPAQHPGLLLKCPFPRCRGPVSACPPPAPCHPQEGPAPAARLRHRERCQGLRQGRTESPVLSLARAGPDPVPSQRAERLHCQPQPHAASPVPLQPPSSANPAAGMAPVGAQHPGDAAGRPAPPVRLPGHRASGWVFVLPRGFTLKGGVSRGVV